MKQVYLVFVTKYKDGIFTNEILDDTRGVFGNVCDFEAELVEFDGESDHLHLLMIYSPKVDVSALAQSLKGASSGMIRKSSRAVHYVMVSELLCGSL